MSKRERERFSGGIYKKCLYMKWNIHGEITIIIYSAYGTNLLQIFVLLPGHFNKTYKLIIGQFNDIFLWIIVHEYRLNLPNTVSNLTLLLNF
jgi:hypothetical protein